MEMVSIAIFVLIGLACIFGYWLILRIVGGKMDHERSQFCGKNDMVPEQDDDDYDVEAGAVMTTVKGSCMWAKFRYRDFVETGDEYEKEQYERFKKKAADATNRIEDEFYHSTACHFMIDLCMHTGDTAEAQVWFDRVSVDMIRDKIKEEFPQLAGPK